MTKSRSNHGRALIAGNSRKERCGLSTSRTAGAMARGRPVRKRVKGFAGDVTTLGRIRTALTLDRTLDSSRVARARILLDELQTILVELSDEKAA
jgi:hypothetical protein